MVTQIWVMPWGRLARCHLPAGGCGDLWGQGSASCSPRGCCLVPHPPVFAVNSRPDKKCHRRRLVSARPLGHLAGLVPARTREVFRDLFVQRAILISSARVWSRTRLGTNVVPPGRGWGRLLGDEGCPRPWVPSRAPRGDPTRGRAGTQSWSHYMHCPVPPIARVARIGGRSPLGDRCGSAEPQAGDPLGAGSINETFEAGSRTLRPPSFCFGCCKRGAELPNTQPSPLILPLVGDTEEEFNSFPSTAAFSMLDSIYHILSNPVCSCSPASPAASPSPLQPGKASEPEAEELKGGKKKKRKMKLLVIMNFGKQKKKIANSLVS